MLIIGLTGSIGTGKTTVAEFLKKQKIPSHKF
nr:dephospho-CoA kinase [Candidatus Liberibacter africanus]